MSLQQDYDDEVSALYAKLARRVLRFLIGMDCDTGLAEEITDDTFLAARRRWSHVRTLKEPEGYIFKIAMHERWKRQPVHDVRAQQLRQDPAEAGPISGGDFAQGIADRAAVLQALRRLPPREREAVVLRDVGDLSEAAAAEAMSVSIGSVKSYTSEGRAKLRAYLDEFRTRRGECE